VQRSVRPCYNVLMQPTDELVTAIRRALKAVPRIEFSVLFGSAASGRLRQDSDLDVAVYCESGGRLEIEEQREIPEEAAVQIALERASGRNVDLLVLNRAPATVCASALLTGRLLTVGNRELYTRYFLAVTSAAIDFLETEREYRAIAARSRSLSDIDRSRLLRIIDFIAEELQDAPTFQSVTLDRYGSDRDLRRNIDRWVEMLINAALDIGKIVLSSMHRPVPQTYGQILSHLESMPHFSELSGALSPLAPLRNLMAHEYLDLRFGRVRWFVDMGAATVGRLAELTHEWLAA